MVRSEYKHHMLGVWVFDFAQQDGNRQAYPCRMFVAGEAPVARRTTGSASRPVVAARKGRPRPRESTEKSWEGKGGCRRTSRTRAAAGQVSVEGGARADRVGSGGRWGSEGRRWVAVPKERALLPCGRGGLPVEGEGGAPPPATLPDGGAASC